MRGLIVPLGLSDAAYRRVLSDGVEALGLPAEPICIDGGEVHAEHALSEPDSDEVLDAVRGPLAPMGSAAPLPLPAAAGLISSSSSSDSSSSSCSKQDSDEVLEVQADNMLDVPDSLEGARIRVEDRRGLSGYVRYIVTRTEHTGCFKRRNTHWRQTAHYGRCEPVVF